MSSAAEFAESEESKEVYINKCLELQDAYPEVFKVRRSRDYLEQRPNIVNFYKRWDSKARRAREGKPYDTASLASGRSVTVREAPTLVANGSGRFQVPDMTRRPARSILRRGGEERREEQREQSDSEDEEDDEEKQRMAILRRIKTMLLRPDVADDFQKSLKALKNADLDEMDLETLQQTEENVQMLFARRYGDYGASRVLGAASRVAEITLGVEKDCISRIVEDDKSLQMDVATVIGKYAVSAGAGIRSIFGFGVDCAQGYFESSRRRRLRPPPAGIAETDPVGAAVEAAAAAATPVAPVAPPIQQRIEQQTAAAASMYDYDYPDD